MFLRNKKIIIFFLAFFLAFAATGFALAQGLEVHYPSVPTARGEITLTSTSTLSEFIKYIFNFSLIVAAVIAFGALVYAGFLYLTSTGNASLLQEAKGRIFASIFGLIIIFSAYILLNTLNPRLLVLKTQPVKLPHAGILLDNGAGEQKVFFTSVSNFKGFSPERYKFLSPPGKIEVTLYSGPNFTATSTVLKYYNDYLRTISYSSGVNMAQSMKIRGIGPGVYLYDDDGNEFGPLDRPITDLSFYKFDKATKIRIKNGSSTNFHTILYNQKGYVGNEARIFFQRQKIPESLFGGGEKPSPPGGSYKVECNPTSTCRRKVSCPGSNHYYLDNDGNATTTCGNVVSITQKLSIQGDDRYGSINKYPLSIDIHQMNLEDARCTVTLYKRPDYQASSTDEKCVINNFLFEPIAIDNSEVCGKGWNDKVKSIKIEGNCFVFLFNNRKNDCCKDYHHLKCSHYHCWTSGGWFSHTGTTHVVESSKPDLKNWSIKYHATSIAIYPGSPSH